MAVSFGHTAVSLGRMAVSSGRTAVSFGRMAVPFGRTAVPIGRVLRPYGRVLSCDNWAGIVGEGGGVRICIGFSIMRKQHSEIQRMIFCSRRNFPMGNTKGNPFYENQQSGAW